MRQFSLRVWHLFLLGLILTPLLHVSGPSSALAQSDGGDDVMGEEDEDIEVEDEDEETVTVPDTPGDDHGTVDEDEGAVMDDEEDDEEEEEITAHSDVETTYIFVGKQGTGEFVAGETVHTMIGFTNRGQSENELVITSIDGSFRYPQDFSYTIQNFSFVQYDTYIKPDSEVTFDYFFTPSESFYARTFGLQINIMYKDLEGAVYRTAVFNDTVNLVDLEEGFDAETFFMYVFMVSGISLLMFIVHYAYTTVVRRPKSTVRRRMETGTQGKDDIDYQWLPEGSIPGTPKKSPRASPRKTRSSNKK